MNPFPVKLSSYLLLTATACLGAAAFIRADEPMIGNRPLSAIAEARIETAAPDYWAGEVFTFTRTTSIASRYFGSLSPDFDWSPPGVIIEDWSAPSRDSVNNREIIIQKARAYVRGTGTVSLPNAAQAVKLVTSRAGDGSAITDPYEVPVNAPRLTIRPLPTPSPAGFLNAVGDFSLRSTLSTLTPKVGESVTWTVELTGSGNWPEINRLPGRVISKDFNAVAPVLKRTIKPGTLFEGTITEDVLLVPTKAGEYQLGPLRFVYFDPKRGKYQMITTETYTLKVGGGAVGATDASVDRYFPANGSRIAVPASPQPLPLDPLGQPWLGMKPIEPGTQNALIIVALVGLLGYWLWLAAQRSELTDPLHARRRARVQLEQTLAALDRQTLSREDLRRLLFAWQKATIQFAALPLATPSSTQVARALEGGHNGTVGSSWAPLWREANAALYGEKTALPTDWVMRARAALSEQTVRPVPFRARFLKRNLLPFAALILVVGLVRPTARADALAAYQKGDFAAAEQEWRQAATAAPLDAHAHYNLALAAAQQNRWPESLAQSLAAFCLEPGNEAIRWQLSLSIEHAGVDNPVFSGFVNGGTKYRIARLTSPAHWGVIRMGAAFLACLLAGVFLTAAYRNRPALTRRLAGVGVMVALIIFISAGVSIRCYGPLAQDSIAVVSRNILLRSVPTEIDSTQKTVPLPAGSLAVVDRTFLGWSRVVFPNHQTAWARTDALVSLYR